MKHIDEHTLELYVLGGKEVRGKRKRIEAHLERCEGCRRLARSISDFYIRAEENLKASPQSASTESVKALVRPRKDAISKYEPIDPTGRLPVIASVPRTLSQHIISYVRQNPITSGVGSVVLVAGLVILAALTTRTPAMDANPSYTLMNTSRMALEVYNKEDQLLWQLPNANIPNVSLEEKSMRVHRTLVADINRDGLNEVVTTLPEPNEQFSFALRIFDYQKKLMLEEPAGALQVRFRSNRYASSYYFENVLVDSVPGSRMMSIFAGADNGRSPWFLLHLDPEGHVLGRYWHFGQMPGQYLYDPGNGGPKRVILTGSNQVDEPDAASFRVVAVLDPAKILGDREASATRGFGMDVSAAELFYVGFPQSDMERALRLPPQYPYLLSSRGENQIRIALNNSDGKKDLGFEYIFSMDMRVIQVKYASGDERVHASLRKEGRITSTFDDRYLENLKRSVRYWDGKDWQKEPTPVKHHSP